MNKKIMDITFVQPYWYGHRQEKRASAYTFLFMTWKQVGQVDKTNVNNHIQHE
jgi:hypothetical protein